MCVASHLNASCVSPCEKKREQLRWLLPQRASLRTSLIHVIPTRENKQLRKLDTPCSFSTSPRGPFKNRVCHVRRFGPHVASRQLRKLGTPCALLYVPISTRHVRHFGPHEGHHSTPRGKELERFPLCASARTPMIHVYSRVERTWSSTRCTQPNAQAPVVDAGEGKHAALARAHSQSVRHTPLSLLLLARRYNKVR